MTSNIVVWIYHSHNLEYLLWHTHAVMLGDSMIFKELEDVETLKSFLFAVSQRIVFD